jgi:hypothetical protein
LVNLVIGTRRIKLGMRGMSGVGVGRVDAQTKKERKFHKTREPCLLDEPCLLLWK